MIPTQETDATCVIPVRPARSPAGSWVFDREVLTMLTAIRWVLGLVVLVIGSKALAEDVKPVVIGGIVYQADNDKAEGVLKAVDAGNSAELWRTPIVDEGKKTRIVGLAAIGRGLIVETNGPGIFFVDTTTHQAEPVLDLRKSRGKDRCEIHDRATIDALVPIHYGFATGRPLTEKQREQFPLASRPIEGGCCVMPEKVAIVRLCPDCH
jgi:hypothetical protein